MSSYSQIVKDTINECEESSFDKNLIDELKEESCGRPRSGSMSRMREGDADYLEQGVNLECMDDFNTTPTLLPVNATERHHQTTSDRSMPKLMLDEHVNSVDSDILHLHDSIHHSSPPARDETLADDSNSSDYFFGCLEDDEERDCETPQTGCTSSETSDFGYGNNLSYKQLQRHTIAPFIHQSPNEDTSEEQGLPQAEPSANNNNMTEPSLPVIREGVESKNLRCAGEIGRLNTTSPNHRGRMRTSKSIDRILNEAAQYAEAVGEIPPLHIDEISREIIEGSSDDDQDDDDDDDAAEVEVTEEEMERTRGKDAPSQDESEESRHIDTVKLENKFTRPELDSPASPKAVLEEPSPETPIHRDSKFTEKYVCTDQTSNHPENKVTTHQNYMSPSKGKWHNTPKYQQKKKRQEKYLMVGMPPMYPEDEEGSQPSSYKGVCSTPPEIILRGLSRGNYAQLHRKAWLEVSDKYHRYGKHLRCYYKHWESLGHPTNMFFDWLDSKGEAAGQPLPNLEECPRSQLDSDTVRYILNPEISETFSLKVARRKDGCMYLVNNDGNVVNTGPDGWIFVLRDSVLYAHPKVTSLSGKSKQRFHHSSFFGGKAVAAAGIIITNEDGKLERLYPHSGHYRPGEAHLHRILFFLQKMGINLKTFVVDTQQIMHVCRNKRNQSTPKGGKGEESGPGDKNTNVTVVKLKKKDSLSLRAANLVASYLSHKAEMIGKGVFSQIHKIRNV